VPIRILALGKSGADRIDADVFLLTDRAPAFLPAPTGANGLRLDYSAAASKSLLDDLRSDRGMSWVPTDGYLSKVAVDASATQLSFDLAIDASGQGMPSWVQAGFKAPAPIVIESSTWVRILAGSILALALVILLVAIRRPVSGRMTPLG
jgi:hypothetical protein